MEDSHLVERIYLFPNRGPGTGIGEIMKGIGEWWKLSVPFQFIHNGFEIVLNLSGSFFQKVEFLPHIFNYVLTDGRFRCPWPSGSP